MKGSSVFVAAAFFCLLTFPTSTVGKNLRFWPKPIEGWPHPSDISRNEMFMSTSHKFNYGDSKVWKCTYSNGSAPAISISPSIPSTPSTPTPSTPSTPTPSTPSPPPPTPKTSPPPPTPSPPPPTPKKSPPPPAPSIPPPTPKKSPSPPPPTPSLPPPTPKKSPSSSPPTLRKSPSLSPPSDDQSSSPSHPSNPPPEHHHSHHHHEYPWEHFNRCIRNIGPVGMCRGEMEFSFYTKLFQVSKYCCDLMVDMESECDDVTWGYFTDPFFVPLVRYTCHITY